MSNTNPRETRCPFSGKIEIEERKGIPKSCTAHLTTQLKEKWKKSKPLWIEWEFEQISNFGNFVQHLFLQSFFLLQLVAFCCRFTTETNNSHFDDFFFNFLKNWALDMSHFETSIFLLPSLFHHRTLFFL